MAENLYSTIDDYLVSLAEGMAAAQAELARISAPGASGERVGYALPRLEFELKMRARVVEDASLTQRFGARVGPRNDVHLTLSPPGTDAGASETELISVIRGSLVAVPRDQGAAAVTVTMDFGASTPDATGRLPLYVHATDARGLPVRNLEVQLDVDWEGSENLLPTELGDDGTLLNTHVDPALARTDADGHAEFTLRLGQKRDPTRPARAVLALDAAETTLTYVVPVP